MEHIGKKWLLLETLLPSKKLPAQSYNRNTGRRCKIRSNLAMKTQERRYQRRSGVFFVTFEHISQLILLFLLLTLNRSLFAMYSLFKNTS